MDNKKSFPLNGLRVCIDSMENGEMSGAFYTPMDGETHFATGFEDFVLKADRLFDKYGYPQAYMTGRSFQEGTDTGNHYHGLPEAVRDYEEISGFRGKVATCDIIVESRRKATWQGFVKDVQGNTLGNFECMLEIIGIINEYFGE